jgi:hypothetical protein
MCALAVLTVALFSQAADQFVLVTKPGWTNSTQYSWTGVWGDYDKDGFVDLFVPNSTASGAWTNFLYHNKGDGTFTRKFAEQVGPIASDKDASLGALWGRREQRWLPRFASLQGSPVGEFAAHNRSALPKPREWHFRVGGRWRFDQGFLRRRLGWLGRLRQRRVA